MDLTEDELRRLVDERARAILREERDNEAAALEARRLDQARADEKARIVSQHDEFWATVVAARDELATARAAEERALRANALVVPAAAALMVLGVVGVLLDLHSVAFLVMLGTLIPLLTAGYNWVLRRTRVGARISLEEALARREKALRTFDGEHAPPPPGDDPYR